MHAVMTKAGSSANPKGVKTYKVAFSFPRAFTDHIDDLIGIPVDIYWNEDLVLRSATIQSVSIKEVKDMDPVHTANLKCQDTDTSLANLSDVVNDSGDLRVAVAQGTLFSKP